MSIYGYVFGNAKNRRDQHRKILSYCGAFGFKLEKVFFDTLEQSPAFAERDGARQAISATQPGDTILVASMQMMINSLEDARFGIEWARSEQIDVLIIDLNTSIFKSPLFIRTVEILCEKYHKHAVGKLAGSSFSGGSRPYGYQVIEGVLHADEDEHRIINTIIDLRKQGNSLRAIRDKLIQEGTVLSHKAIERILQREAD